MDKRTKITRLARNADNPYAQIARAALQDPILSLKATGLLAYLLSLPDDWIIYASDLAKRKKDKRVAVQSTLNELILAGYLERTIIRDDNGRFIRHDYMVYESPRMMNRVFPSTKKRKKRKGNGKALDWRETEDAIARRECEKSGARHTSRTPQEEL